MSLFAKIKEHAWTASIGAVLTIVGAAAVSGGASWADDRYLLISTYSHDQINRGVLTIDMQIRQVDWRLRDAAQQLAEGRVRGDTRMTSQAEADQVFYGAEKETLLRRRSDVLRGQ